MAKASDNLFPYVHLVPAAAPASPAAGAERLYLDSGDSNKLKRKNSSGTVTTIEGGGGGSASDDNEAAASTLVNATATGDAGGRSDHFLGSSLTGWTTVNVSGAATIQVGKSTLSLASSGDSYIYRAFTPSGAFTVEARLALHPGTAGSVDLLVTDYTGAGTPVTNGSGLNLALFFSSGAPVAGFTTIASGTRTSRGSNTRIDGYVYLRLVRDGSNNVQAFYSADRNKWIPFASAAALTFTPARLVLRCGDSTGAVVDFVDVAA